MSGPASARTGNKFKIGLFAANCDGGIAATTVPERWQPTWENNAALARMADEAGIEFMLPLGRWAGYGGDTDHNGTSFETLVWAAGILASTRHIMAFATLHVALVNPVFAAKQMVTIDHIGAGRFGLNIVCGWNEDEFGMFGIPLGAHGDRYAQGEEWLAAVRRIWSETQPFDFDGDFYHLHNVRARPKPVHARGPVIMVAGQSEAGREFAEKHGDYLFRGIRTMAFAERDIAILKSRTDALDRDVGIFTNAYMVCRPTRREAEEYHHYYAVEHEDEGSVERMFVGRGLRDDPNLSDEAKTALRRRLAAGNSAYPLIGTPDEVVAEIEMLSAMGLSGIALGLVNYIDHFPYVRDEVLPRLERKGLRQKAAS